jgi:hypothetical protein
MREMVDLQLNYSRGAFRDVQVGASICSTFHAVGADGQGPC